MIITVNLHLHVYNSYSESFHFGMANVFHFKRKYYKHEGYDFLISKQSFE